MMTVKIFKVSRIESRMGHGFSVVIGKRSVDIIRGSKGDYHPLNIRSLGRLMISSRRVIGFSSLDSLQLTLRQLATRHKLSVMDILGFTLLGRSVLLSYHLQMNTRMVAYSGATLTITRSLTLAWRKSMNRLPCKPCTTGRMIAA